MKRNLRNCLVVAKKKKILVVAKIAWQKKKKKVWYSVAWLVLGG